MDSCLLGFIFAFLFVVSSVHSSRAQNAASFHDNYNVTWGHDHALLLKKDREIQLSLDKYSGAGFESKLRYGSGFFHIRMKIPEKNSAGVVTTFYLSSRSSHHDEIDFEILGNNGPPYKLHTNVYSKGKGGREQRIQLWFDPTKHFHSYKILWNEHQVVFYVDDVPIRVFKNNILNGVSYPSQPMHIMASVWNGETWASEGKKKIDWTQAPFQAHFQEFHVDGCELQENESGKCYSPKFWWNGEKYWKLNAHEQRLYKKMRSKYLVYDYCSDESRYQKQPPECLSNQ